MPPVRLLASLVFRYLNGKVDYHILYIILHIYRIHRRRSYMDKVYSKNHVYRVYILFGWSLRQHAKIFVYIL